MISAAAWRAWTKATGRAIAGTGSDRLGSELARALACLVPFDSPTAFACPVGIRPLLLHDGLTDGTVAPLTAHLESTHRLDPFCHVCAERRPPGLHRMRDIAPDRFFAGEHVQNRTVRPRISMNSGTLAEEIGFLAVLPSGAMAAFSLMRHHSRPPFSDVELARLRRSRWRPWRGVGRRFPRSGSLGSIGWPRSGRSATWPASTTSRRSW